MTQLTTIGFDADDTLWQNEQFFRLTEQRFQALLAGHACALRGPLPPLFSGERVRERGGHKPQHLQPPLTPTLSP